MSGIWHPSITAYEIYGSRQENWNDGNPSVSVILQVPAVTLLTFVNDVVFYKYDWPENSEAPFYLYANNVEILPQQHRYGSNITEEKIVRNGSSMGDETELVRVTYGPKTEYLRTVLTTVGTGTGTGSGDQYQSVWVSYSRIVSTEFLTMDYNDFGWIRSQTGTKLDPLKPDEAPGKPMRSIKYVLTFKNIYLTEDLEDIVNGYSGTVNSSTLTAPLGWPTFTESQVLFNVEDVSPSITKVLPYFGVAPKELVNLRISFNCRTGEGSWNKYWRAKVAEDNSADDSGWFDMYHKPQPGGPSAALRFYPYQKTSYWFPLWV